MCILIRSQEALPLCKRALEIREKVRVNCQMDNHGCQLYQYCKLFLFNCAFKGVQNLQII